MKAINCSQCGAIIINFSKADEFADCDYCKARIRIREQKIIEVSNNKKKIEEESLSSYERYWQKRREIHEKSRRNKQMYSPQKDSDNTVYFDGFSYVSASQILIFIAVIALLITLPIAISLFFAKPAEITKKSIVDKKPTTTLEPQKEKCPNISLGTFHLYLKEDKHHIESPKITKSALPTCNIRELRKTIFSDRNSRVRVKVAIDKNGNVTGARLIKGDKFFKESAEKAAFKSIFIKQKRNTNKIIEYWYNLYERKKSD